MAGYRGRLGGLFFFFFFTNLPFLFPAWTGPFAYILG